MPRPLGEGSYAIAPSTRETIAFFYALQLAELLTSGGLAMEIAAPERHSSEIIVRTMAV